MDKKQKEALIIALAEKGESYRTIAKEARVAPNTIKAVLNKAGLDESTSISSRAFELYLKQKTPVEVAIELHLEAEEAIRLYHDYFKLLGISRFTQVYLQIKDNPMGFVNFFILSQNAGMGDAEIVQLLKIANGYLPRVRLEYDRLHQEINSTKAELNSWKAELNNIARTYQQFVDRNVALKRREEELRRDIDEMENKKNELQKVMGELEQKLSEPLEFNVDNNSLDLEVKQEEVISANNVPPSNMVIDSPM